MSTKEAKAVLEIASDAVKCGIYAVEKDNIIDMKRGEMSKTQLHKERSYYKSQGFKVYFNGL